MRKDTHREKSGREVAGSVSRGRAREREKNDGLVCMYANMNIKKSVCMNYRNTKWRAPAWRKEESEYDREGLIKCMCVEKP